MAPSSDQSRWATAFGDRLAHAVVRVLGDVDPPDALHPRHQAAVPGDESRPVVDDPVQRPDHVGTVAELSALVLTVEECALERRRLDPVLRSRAEEQQPGDGRHHAAGVLRGEAEIRLQPRTLRGIHGVGQAAHLGEVLAQQRVVEFP